MSELFTDENLEAVEFVSSWKKERYSGDGLHTRGSKAVRDTA